MKKKLKQEEFLSWDGVGEESEINAYGSKEIITVLIINRFNLPKCHTSDHICLMSTQSVLYQRTILPNYS